MKYRKYIILALVLVSGLFSCQRDEDIAIAMLNINSEVIESSYTSADIECYVKCNTKFDNVVIEYALSEDFADAQSATMSEKEGKYHAKCVNLLDDTTYYIRYVVSNRLSSMTYKEISSFKTLKPSIPVVHLDSISNIWDVKADAFVHVEFDGGSPLSEWGITIWTDETTDTLRIKTESQEQCLIPIQDLQPNTIYKARAYAINKVGVAYSEQEIIFTTFALPEVQTNEITDIQLTTALLNGNLIFNGNDTATILGFCWGETPQPTISNNQKQVTTNSNNFAYQLSNLKDETKYYVRAYATNKIGISYGEEKSFTTTSAIKPTLTTSSPTNISYTSATVGGNVTSDGGANVTERGVVYSTNQNPTTSNSKVTSGNGVGSFTCNLTNLQENTKYYVRAYAINKKGTSYGPQASFTTKAYALPTLTTSSATNISFTSATIGGNVTSDGGASVTERGVVYSTSLGPTISNRKIVSGSGTGSFTCNITNLQENTKYYVRAYAINKKGTAYGEQQSFMTEKPGMFSVSSSKQVYFSPGNLQYHPANNKWRFAENQTDYIGASNSNCSSTYNGWLDLFGWSTSANNCGVSTSKDYTDYSGSFVDWGTNRIGSNAAPNTWRTLTYDEWKYLLNTRPNASSLKGVAQVNGVNGLILLPDSWTCPSGVTFKSGFHSNYGVEYYAAYQTFTADQWSKLEAAGAVFLPAAGYRQGSVVHYVRSYGFYWSATEFNSNVAGLIDFGSNEMSFGGYDRYYGQSVRLIKDL